MLHADGNVGDELPLACPRHPDTVKAIRSAQDVPDALTSVCGRVCGAQMACGVVGHTCPRACHRASGDSDHNAKRCLTLVSRQHTRCQKPGEHVYQRECREDRHLFEPCPFTEEINCPNSSHDGTPHILRRRCNETAEAVIAKCHYPCPRSLNCSHPCQDVCSAPCTERCSQKMQYACVRDSAHVVWGICCEGPQVASATCTALVNVKCQRGIHMVSGQCRVSAEEIAMSCKADAEFDCDNRAEPVHKCLGPCNRGPGFASARCAFEVDFCCVRDSRHSVKGRCHESAEAASKRCYMPILKPCARVWAHGSFKAECWETDVPDRCQLCVLQRQSWGSNSRKRKRGGRA
eukprot:TRINITY_DN35781_c0_g3_i1.p1 TRINITY_DN35781_c0_g3~~TRINITY_DN35781_c0_g3_i1.p1  ORF type:complete len:400 (+),score=18.22 TRINITY_DN35781_c0_g3_i1:158-1201(+)